jgi:L-asparaginase / beta-aspartyl-peptidase
MSQSLPTLVTNSSLSSNEKVPPVHGKAVLVIHGGAGNLTRDRYPPELQQKYRAALKLALETGHAILARGGCALDVVEAAITIMEDNPLFNAGKGAALTKEGEVELEASIMVSHPGAAGDPTGDPTRRTAAVTMLQHVKNPITLAKKLYLARGDTPHVLHAGPHAERLAELSGCEMVQESYFHTPVRDEQFVSGDYTGIADVDAKGTVGAVALDVNGYIAVGTSTGGKRGKLPGRIGDSPVPGAGFWSEQFFVKKCKSIWQKIFSMSNNSMENVSMGVSGTGDGDYFLRYAVCHDICERMKLKGQSLDSATKGVLRELGDAGAEGGVIGLSGEGDIVMGMNCAGMFRGWIDVAEGKARVAVFCDDRVC